MALNIPKLIQFALTVGDKAVEGGVRTRVTYISVPENPEYNPDNGQIINAREIPDVPVLASGYSAFEIATQVAQIKDIKFTIAALDMPSDFMPSTNDRVIYDGQTCLVKDWTVGTIKGSIYFIRATRP